MKIHSVLLIVRLTMVAGLMAALSACATSSADRNIASSDSGCAKGDEPCNVHTDEASYRLGTFQMNRPSRN